jgi:protein-S-isoprenylcysteine O-methyltransferase Ste14
VPLGWVAGAIVLGLARPRPWSLAAGLVLGLAGEALRIWASGHIEKTRVLATGGPYAHTRNPLYLGSTLMAMGIALAAATPWAALAVAVYFFVFYPAAIRGEAAFLGERFGTAYAGWAQAVPAFWPRLTPGGPRTSRFSWQRVRDNREWRTLMAVPLALVLVWLRGRLFG